MPWLRLDVQDKKVFISVRGNPEGRRRLLAIIRADFESIHASLEKFQPAEMVPLPTAPIFVRPGALPQAAGTGGKRNGEVRGGLEMRPLS